MPEEETDPLGEQLRHALHEVADRHDPSPAAGLGRVSEDLRRASTRRRRFLVGGPVVVILLVMLAVVALRDDDDATQIAANGGEASGSEADAEAQKKAETEKSAVTEAPRPGSVPNQQPPPDGNDQTPTSQGTGPSGTAAVDPQSGGGTPTTAADPTVQDGRVLITESADGKTIHIKPGDVVDLQLDGGAMVWDEPSVDQPATLSRTSSTQSPDGSARATYVAKSAGQAVISAEGNPSCSQDSPPCMAPSRIFSVTIVVD